MTDLHAETELTAGASNVITFPTAWTPEAHTVPEAAEVHRITTALGPATVDLGKTTAPAAADTEAFKVPPTLVVGAPNFGLELAEDIEGDLPWFPLWTRSADGWKARGHVVLRNRRRAARRWVSRQRTERGHAAQFKRGTVRTAEWVGGLEGANVDAARNLAYMTAKDSRQSARKARFKVLPSSKAKARAEAEKTQTAAIAAANLYKKTKKDRNRARMWRGATAYVPPVAAITGGYVTQGMLGAASGALATFTGGAFVGRHPNYVDDTYGSEFEYLGDGVAMTEPLLNRVYIAAGVIAKDESLRMVTPAMLERDGRAWCAMFDLPPGVTAKKAMAASESLASAFGVEVAQVDQGRAGRAGRIDLRVSKELPFTGDPAPGPLLAHEGPINFWNRISMGVTARGEQVMTSWVERSGLFGGEPGAGKSAAANNVLLAAALDPRVSLWLADGKGGGDLEFYEGIVDEYEPDGDGDAMLAFLEKLHREMKARYRFLKSLGKRKVTEELAAKYPQLRQLVCYIDELAGYLTDDEKLGKKIASLIRRIVSKGRAAAIITICATQKPASDVVPTGLRDILSIRYALRCLTPQASDTVLGQGAAAAGYSAKAIESEMRGAGFLWAEGTNPVMVLSHYYNDDEVVALLTRAYAMRQAAGTLPAGEQPVAQQLRALGTDEGNVLAVLVEAFEEYEQDGERGAEWLPTSALMERLTAAGVEITEARLGKLVARTAEESKRQEWDGKKTAGYPLTAITTAVAKVFELTA